MTYKNNRFNVDRASTVLFVLMYFFLCLILVIAYTNPASSYEYSIYQSSGFLVVTLLLIIGLISLYLVLIHILYRSLQKLTFFASFGLLALTYISMLSLHIIRGYYMMGFTGDVPAHIGIMKLIVLDGTYPNTLKYPFSHIYGVIISTICDLSFISIVKYIPLIFGVLFLLSVAVLARLIYSKDPNLVVLSTIPVFCFSLFGISYFTPNALSNMIFPLIIFLLTSLIFKKRNRLVLLLIFLLLCPFFHPLIVIIMLLVLIAYFIYYYSNVNQHLLDITIELPFNSILLLFIIISTIFIFWISGFREWSYNIGIIYDSIIYSGDITKLDSMMNLVSTADSRGYNIWIELLKSYYNELILILSAMVSLMVIIKYKVSEYYIFLYYAICILVILLATISILLTSKFVSFGPLRFLFYIGVFCCFSFAYIIKYYLFSSKTGIVYNNKFKFFLIALVIFFAYYVGFWSFYPSPFTNSISTQGQLSEISGLEFYFNNHDLDVKPVGISGPLGKVESMILSPEEQIKQQNPRYFQGEYQVPLHFGYDTNISIYDYYLEDRYILLSSRDIIIYQYIFPTMANDRWNITDFYRINIDPHVNSVYSNDNYHIFYIK